MRGKHRVIVQNNKLHYEFDIKRNITIIKGDSATGKTTLIDMIRLAQNLGESSGIELSCDVPCRVLEGPDWKLLLSNIHEHIIFIDEENAFINSEDFAEEVSKSDNYFVLITRENLYNLPYSVEEIYGIHSYGKYQNTKRIYQEIYKIYGSDIVLPLNPDTVITEDSKSGNEFFSAVCKNNEIKCISAEGKSKVYATLKNIPESDKICVIADGAAFGSEMNRVYDLVSRNKNMSLYLPESFEWIILKSGIIDGNTVQDILDHPEDYIDGKEFFSWERFFERLLIDKTLGTYLQYSKTKLAEPYLHDGNRKAILAVLGEENIILEE